MKTSFILLLLPFLLCSCNPRKVIHAEGNPLVREIIVDPDKYVERVDGTFLIDTSYTEFIPLETNDECLIAEATRIYLRDDKIIVYDFLAASAFIFNSDGSYHAKINNTGNGPGEYPPIVNDMVVTEKHIGVLVPNIGKIMFYDFDGKHVKDISIKGKWGYSFFTFDDEKYYLINGFDNANGKFSYLFYTTDANGTDEYFLPFSKHDDKVKRGWGLGRYFSKLENHAHVIIGSIDTIYKVTPTENIYPEYYINITKNELPKEDREGPASIAVHKAVTSDLILGLQVIMETDKYLFLNFYDFICIYDKQTEEIIHTALFYEVPAFGNAILPLGKSGNIENGKYLIGQLNPYVYENRERMIESIENEERDKYESKAYKAKLIQAFKSIKSESDNPIIILYKLK